MNRFAVSAAVLSAAIFLSSAAQAMEIRQFDRMDDRDQAAYVGLLVQGAERVLIGEGRADLATQVDRLFRTIPAGDKMALGMTEFERNLSLARVEDARNAEQNPRLPRIEVEDAMAVTLQKNHIDLPDSFYTVSGNFWPKLPPKK